MSVWKRVLVKTMILLAVIALSGGGAACWQAYRQSTPEYAMDKYLSFLIDNAGDKAYELLDQSEDAAMSAEEYSTALKEKKYSLYSGYQADELEKRLDNDGNEYVDYHASFVNAGDEVQLEENFTVKKQAEARFGIFDQWKVLSGHCMVKNFQLTVPAGSEVYLDNAKADSGWIVQGETQPSVTCYRIPSLLPGKISLVIRHPALESVNTTLDALDGSADYSGKMALKQSAQDACKEIGVNALKKLYAGAALEKTDELEELFADCTDEAKAIVKEQGKRFNREDAVFKSAGLSDFAAVFGEPVFTEEKNGAITTEMKLSYRYLLKEDVTVDTEEVLEDGTVVQETQTDSETGDAGATFVMSFYQDAWHIASVEGVTIPADDTITG